MRPLHLPSPALAELFNHLISCFPEEGCGVVLGSVSDPHAARFVPMPNLQGRLHTMDPAAVRRAVLGDGLRLELPSGEVVLGLEEVVVEVSPREHFQAAGSASAVVALHADLDDDLREEGLAREVLSRVQTIRRELNLGYTQRIDLSIDGDPALVKAAERFREHLSRESLVRQWGAGDGGEARTLDVDGLALILRVSPV